MSYLLDTNIVSDLIKYPDGLVQQRVLKLGEAQISTSIIVAAELRFGAEKSGSVVLANKIEEALDRLSVLPLRTPVDTTYAHIRTQLERAGTPIGNNDYLIATQAMTYDLTLVTNNVREFSRVEDLQIENWLEDESR